MSASAQSPRKACLWLRALSTYVARSVTPPAAPAEATRCSCSLTNIVNRSTSDGDWIRGIKGGAFITGGRVKMMIRLAAHCKAMHYCRTSPQATATAGSSSPRCLSMQHTTQYHQFDQISPRCWTQSHSSPGSYKHVCMLICNSQEYTATLACWVIVWLVGCCCSVVTVPTS